MRYERARKSYKALSHRGFLVFPALLGIKNKKVSSQTEWKYCVLSSGFFSVFLEGLKSFTRPSAFMFFHSVRSEGRIGLERKMLDSGYPVFPRVPRAFSMLNRRMQFRSERPVIEW